MIKRVLFLIIISQSYINAQMDTTSYSIGLLVAKNLKSQGFTEVDKESFNLAMEDVLSGNELKINVDEANGIVQNYLTEQRNKIHSANKKAGEDFLANNKTKEGVVTTETGLQYVVLEEGTGTERPSLLNEVNVHYHGTLISGEVFDSSVDRGEPISFKLNGVINGWQEGLQLMTIGSKFRFFIPYNLAYGERGAGASIQPFSTLIFDVTLLGIN